MKLERLHEYVTAFVVTLLGIGFAVYCGQLSGAGQSSMIIMLLVIGVVTIIGMTLRAGIWIFIPLCWTVIGRLPFLPVPFSVRDLGVFLAFGWFLIFKALKIVRKKPRYTFLEFVMFANLAYLLSVYIRNPVGVEAFGSDLVGGRPYFDVAVAFLGYWVLAQADLSPKGVRRLPFLLLAGQSIGAIAGFITFHFPSTVPIIGRIYTGISPNSFNAEMKMEAEEFSGLRRQDFLGYLGQSMVTALSSYFRPITVINPIYLGRFLCLLTAGYLILASGFRICVFSALSALVLGSYYRRRKDDIFKMVAFGIPLLGLVIASNGLLFDLPMPAQRALSFLPGRWSTEAVEEAHGSTEWRVFMWKAMLTEDKYLRNRWLGDGFGYSVQQYKAILETNSKNADAVQENFLITGQVHSGPISTIRYAGVVGLVLYIILLVISAKVASKLVNDSLNTPYFPAALFFGATIIMEPLFFIFVFGGFDSALPDTIFRVGILRMIQNGFENHRMQAQSLQQAQVADALPVLLGSQKRA